MKKISLIFIIVLMTLVMIGCSNDKPKQYTVNVINGTIKDENVSTKKVNELDIVVVVPSETSGEFIGWYAEDKLISSQKEYIFQVEKDITLEAKFGSLTSLKNGYYILTNKVERALDITESYVFNAILINGSNVTWYEVDYQGSGQQNGTVTVEGNKVNIIEVDHKM